jgi:DNA-binding response OmpR family regulator
MAQTDHRALVVEDTASVRELVAALLRQQGFAVETADDGEAGARLARAYRPDMVVLDIGLPGLDGLEVCRRIREFSDAYVLMLTGHDTEVDKVVGFASGADDYITKPFSTPEFLGRIGAVARRLGRPARPAVPDPEVRSFGELQIHPAAREAVLAGSPLDLTRIEFDLLEVLSSEPRVVFTRAKLLERIWGPNWFGDDHIVEVHVSNLRRKLGDQSRPSGYVRTVRGVGYRMGSGG